MLTTGGHVREECGVEARGFEENAPGGELCLLPGSVHQSKFSDDLKEKLCALLQYTAYARRWCVPRATVLYLVLTRDTGKISLKSEVTAISVCVNISVRACACVRVHARACVRVSSLNLIQFPFIVCI